MLTEEKKEQFIEAFDLLPDDIQDGLFNTIIRQAEKYRCVEERPALRLVVNGCVVNRKRR